MRFQLPQFIETEIKIIGPFATGDDAADWGAAFCAPGGPDDPRWNVVLLENDAIDTQADGSPYLTISVVAPTGSVEKGAYRHAKAVLGDLIF